MSDSMLARLIHSPVPAGRNETGYRPQLDALRFVAVMGVLVAHLWHYNIFPGVFSLVDWADAGVRLFFVLSGFLITGILLRSRDGVHQGKAGAWFSIRQFYVRRFLRIFPIYYLVVALVLLFGVPPAREIWPWLVSYTTNFYISGSQHWIGQIGHFWSLAVEEQYYLVWAGLVILFPRKVLLRYRAQAPLLAGLILIGPLYRLYLARNFLPDIIGDVTTGTHTLACIDSLGMGSLLAICLHRTRDPVRAHRLLNRVVLPVGLLGYLSFYFYYYFTRQVLFVYPLEDFFLSMFFTWLVASASVGFSGPLGRALEFKPLIYLGKITYGIYVYHPFTPLLVLPLLHSVGIAIQDRSFASFVICSIASIIVAMVSWEGIEKRINALKRRFEYTPERAFPPAAVQSEPSPERFSSSG